MNPLTSLSSEELALLAKKLRQETSFLASEPIAITGVSCRFPGGANSPAEYWRLLINGVDTVGPVPPDRWNTAAYYDPNPDAPNKTYSRHGGFLNYPVADFDAAYFGITPREANYLDPQQRLLLEIACEAFSDARLSHSEVEGSNTGVFIGISGMDYLHCTAEGKRIDAYSGTGNAHSAAAGRISYTFGLQGPCLALDTACSSSLVAIHLACVSLRCLECDLALAGGVNLLLSPTTTIGFSKARMLSPTGHCQSFDIGADGYVRGEGCGAFVLKRLSDAIANRDRVLAVIRGSAVNQGGKSMGLTVPKGPSQQNVIRRALEFVDPASVDYIEAQGTGTSLGDPIEIHALRDVFGIGRERPLYVGSVKTNIGHLEAAAGMAGMIKAVMALQNEQIPPNLHFNNLNPNIILHGSPFIVPTEPIPWPKVPGRRRRAGVSSFGFTGTNSHIVVEEAPLTQATATASRRENPSITCDFKRKRFWIPNAPPLFPEHKQTNGHPMLSERMLLANGDIVFESQIEGEGTDSLSFLADHRAFGRSIVPAACYVEMIVAAAKAGLSLKGIDIENLSVVQPMILTTTGARTIQCLVKPTEESGLFDVSIVSQSDGSSYLHCTAQIRSAAATSPPCCPEDFASGRMDEWEGAAFYRKLRQIGLEYGPAFKTISSMRAGKSTATSKLANFGEKDERFYIDPRLLDGALQTIAGTLHIPVALLPTSIRRVYVSNDLTGTPEAACCRLVDDRTSGDVASATADVFVMSDGRPMLTMEGISLRPFPQTMFDAKEQTHNQAKAYRLEWKQVDVPDKTRSPRCILIGDDIAVLHEICEQSDLSKEQVAFASPDDAEQIRTFLEDGSTNILIPIGWNLPFTSSVGSHVLSESMWGFADTILKTISCCGNQTDAHVALVTCGSQHPTGLSCESPVSSMVWGLARSIALERPRLHVTCVDLGLHPSPVEISQLMAIVATDAQEDHVLLRSAECYVGRLKEIAPVPQEPGRALYPSPNGLMDRMEWRNFERKRPAPDEVEVKVLSSGLNFRDVLCALGLYPGLSGPLGGEFVGTVTRVGAASSHLVPGQRVLGLGGGAFGEYVTTPHDLVTPIGQGVSDVVAASVPIAWLTAWWGLSELAKVKAGQRVLIHSAAGGVGMMAVQLALRAGAEVWATVSTPSKVAKLEELGVRHIFSSRDTTFATRIRELTSNAGVDIVLNSLTGAFIEASLSIVSRGGYFLEIGKKGVWAPEVVESMRPDVQYVCYDVADICSRQPSKVSALLKLMASELENGTLSSSPCQEFPIDEVEEAFRLMTKGQHIGKIVFRHEQRMERERGIDGVFLITGGLGALGLETARWLASQGVKHAILASRDISKSALPGVTAVLSEIKAMGCEISLEPLDVSDYGAVRRVVGKYGDLTGVVHAAGVLDDGLIPDQDRRHFGNVLGAQALGAWNLHQAVADRTLAHFVLYGSIAGVLGSPGQANYAAANAFLTGLAAHRVGIGKNCLCVSWGPFDNLGMTASDRRQLFSRFKSRGVTALNTTRSFDILYNLMTTAQGAIVVCDVDWNMVADEMGSSFPQYLSELSHDHAMVRNYDLLDRLKASSPDEWSSTMLSLVSIELAQIMGLGSVIDLDPNRGFFESGMDSLMAVELRNRLESGFGCSLPPTVAFENPTAQKLSEMLLERLQLDAQGAPTAGGSENNAGIKLSHNHLDQLSDEDISQLLAAEICSFRTSE